MIVKRKSNCYRVLSENEKDREAMIKFTEWALQNDIEVDFIDDNIRSAVKFFVSGKAYDAYLEGEELLDKLFSFIEK
ncbi:MAG: hypothetical protein QW097_01790 [archaeon]